MNATTSRAADTPTGAGAGTGTGTAPRDFIRAIVADDLAAGRHATVATRFPPEPNGYLHIGHAKSIVLNFGLARENGGTCNLRFDDTNPLTEDMEFVESIQENVRWLGYEWDALHFASDYFDRLYDRAERLIEKGLAYVDSLSEEEIRAHRGTVTEPGRESPYRDRSVEENLDLFRRMREGEFPEGSHVLRAKIDMAAPNMKMRDPLLYRIRHAEHYRTGDRWCIYPMYDFTHCLSDSFERITHSLCTLEFENNRELYDWILDAVEEPEPHPRQIEFARLNLSYTVLSKRRLLELVEEGHVEGWDDPRMPTLSGLRRRGLTPAAIRDFCERIGVARADNVVDVALLEHSVRDDLNTRAPRVLCVLRPLKLVIENYPEGPPGGAEELDAPYFPRDVGKPGSRKLPFSRELWIERDDFALDPPKGFHRLAPGREVRLRYGYVVRCTGVVRDPETGEVTEVRCTYDPQTRGGSAPDGRKVKGTIHWVSAAHAREAEVRLYDRLFQVPRPAAGEGDYRSHLNPESLVTLTGCKLEPAAADSEPGARFQFERQGYFYRDPVANAGRGPGEPPVFHRIVTLRDTWAKVAGRAATGQGDRNGPQEDLRAKARERFVDPPEGDRKPDRRPAALRRDPLDALSAVERSRYDRLITELAVGPEDARVLATDPEEDGRADLFREAVAVHDSPRTVANWLVNELPRAGGDRPVSELPFGGRELAELVALVDDGTLSSTLGREVLEELVARGGSPREIVRRRDLEQVSDAAALEAAVERALAEHPEEAERLRSGEDKLRGFFVGRVMRATGGKANPELVQRLLRERSGAG
ncbi:MAG: glutamine--tRNA ligase/YqeY domain fusion protein [Thermoanaerobaculia bacterium]